jgi:hypothetical protein
MSLVDDMAKRTFHGVLWMAFQSAKDERRSLIHAWGDDKTEDAVKNAYADIEAIERLQKQLFGATESRRNPQPSRTLTWQEFQKLFEENKRV